MIATFDVPRAVVTGGRGLRDGQWVAHDLWALAEQAGLRWFAHGGATGADSIAADVWCAIGATGLDPWTVSDYSVDPTRDGPWPAAGARRNDRMIREEARLSRLAKERVVGLAYPDPLSRGTWDAVRRMLGVGMPVLVTVPRELRGVWAAELGPGSWRPMLVGDPADGRSLIVPGWLRTADSWRALVRVLA